MEEEEGLPVGLHQPYMLRLTAKARPNYIRSLCLQGALDFQKITLIISSDIFSTESCVDIECVGASWWRDHSSAAAAPLPIIVTDMQFENYTHKIIPNLSSC